ncbi:hypothetical protein DERF_011642 [Dermatophagoides farinae]|uniref:Uncharacterized protein n=1 Tax=Dermatophagoides farinae TaxID=6954 RepID=A0A922HWH7_DERFA|nr:hypothetical protein DERF_011642 [Dermatophagoides farinae]
MFIKQRRLQQISTFNELIRASIESLLPVPIESFDDQIIPTFILGPVWISSCVAVMFLLYDIIISLFIRIAIIWNRRFWHEAIEILRHNHIGRQHVIHGSSSSSSNHHNSDETQNSMKLNSSSSSLLATINLRANILKLMKKTLKKTGQNRSNFDSTIVGHTWRTIFFLTDVCDDRHLCRKCTIETINPHNYHHQQHYYVNKQRRNYIRSLIDRFLLIGNHIICLLAIIVNYNQILFYLSSIFYISMSIPLTWIELFVRTKPELQTIYQRQKLCGYKRLNRLNNICILIISAINFIMFSTFFIFYISYDNFIRNMATELASNIY